jgi:hypothetical protein
VWIKSNKKPMKGKGTKETKVENIIRCWYDLDEN